ncbi:hypothetical protein CCB80_09410 [Armatimonadetes bacterium Uphvl-Ar1]|nr:hypothetical protein CCB80_09410 [Armatimonadetes bacterium Uphvl-Ar1]
MDAVELEVKGLRSKIKDLERRVHGRSIPPPRPVAHNEIDRIDFNVLLGREENIETKPLYDDKLSNLFKDTPSQYRSTMAFLLLLLLLIIFIMNYRP